MVAFTAITESIRVTVRPVYLDGQSDVVNGRFVFGYYVSIENKGLDTIQLLRRHWFIYDESGKVQEVEGGGVVGKQPTIEPGSTHEYNSYCVIETFSGSMEGYYLMERTGGERFQVTIPRFNLSAAAN